jgi:hypothetical protein
VVERSAVPARKLRPGTAALVVLNGEVAGIAHRLALPVMREVGRKIEGLEFLQAATTYNHQDIVPQLFEMLYDRVAEDVEACLERMDGLPSSPPIG